MPAKLDYPNASFERCLEMAAAVDSLGGSCLKITAADKMQQTMSGAFKTLIGATCKYGLIKNVASGKIENTEIYKDIKLAYTEEDRNKLLAQVFLTPKTFKDLYEKFKNKELPVKILDKVLMKEYSVNEDDASKVAKYLLKGLQKVGLINNDNYVLDFDVSEIETVEAIGDDNVDHKEERSDNTKVTLSGQYNGHSSDKIISIIPHDKFVFHIYGPGLDTTIQVREEEDLMIVEATIKKIKKSLNENAAN